MYDGLTKSARRPVSGWGITTGCSTGGKAASKRATARTMTQDYAWFYKGEPYSSFDRKRETMERFAEETIQTFERATP